MGPIQKRRTEEGFEEGLPSAKSLVGTIENYEERVKEQDMELQDYLLRLQGLEKMKQQLA